MDSENITIKRKSSRPYDRGRFFLLFFLFTGFQIMQAACSPEVYTRTEIGRDAKIVISEGTSVFGLENLHITTAEIKETQNQSKNTKKIRIEKKRRFPKAKHRITKTQYLKKSAYNFSNNPKSKTHFYHSLLRGYGFAGSSFSFKCIIANEMKIVGVLLLIISIFLINFYKSRLFSGSYFLPNFQRPPPGLIL